ncbi:DUF1501 domain-containing protein [Vibrio sp. TRT 29B02]|uniref:DUF1501 domain-containing protein n=1 Tax=unclassified Vibrio TaxID=2614977 RepID=UPI003CFB82F4
MSLSRRTFIKGLGATTMVSQFGWATPSVNLNDYRALVCVFLSGGNDGFNTIIPMDDAHYSEYASIRESIKIEKNDLLPTNLTCFDNDGMEVQLGLHPAMTGIQELSNRGYVNAVINCGVLKQPMERGDNGSEPSMLFSHNSQSQEWLRGNAADRALPSGWGARLMQQLLLTSNHSPLYSFSGNSRLFRGGIKSNSLSPSGAKGMTMHPRTLEQFKNTLDNPRPEYFREYMRGLMRDSVYASEQLDAILEVESPDPYGALRLDTENSLSLQLDAVVKFIDSRVVLGQNRQIYYVNLGGFDTHANQVSDHHILLENFSRAMKNFYDILDAKGLATQVTSVTMSDFGRRIVPNHTGTDHGWGNNHFIIGGAPFTSNTTGVWPSLVPGSRDDFSTGRLIPTTSVDQIGATMAQWLGVQDSQLTAVFPNLDKFTPSILSLFA